MMRSFKENTSKQHYDLIKALDMRQEITYPDFPPPNVKIFLEFKPSFSALYNRLQ